MACAAFFPKSVSIFSNLFYIDGGEKALQQILIARWRSDANMLQMMIMRARNEPADSYEDGMTVSLEMFLDILIAAGVLRHGSDWL